MVRTWKLNPLLRMLTTVVLILSIGAGCSFMMANYTLLQAQIGRVRVLKDKEPGGIRPPSPSS